MYRIVLYPLIAAVALSGFAGGRWLEASGLLHRITVTVGTSAGVPERVFREPPGQPPPGSRGPSATEPPTGGTSPSPAGPTDEDTAPTPTDADSPTDTATPADTGTPTPATSPTDPSTTGTSSPSPAPS